MECQERAADRLLFTSKGAAGITDRQRFHRAGLRAVGHGHRAGGRAGLANETWQEANEPEVILDAKTEHMDTRASRSL